MRLFNNVSAAAVAAAVLVIGPAQWASAGQAASSAAVKVDDSAIEARITDSFKKSSTLAPRDIDVDVSGGVVKLTGTVRTAAEKAEAGQLANVTGVTRVNNAIEIDPKLDQSKVDAAAAKTKSGLSKAVDGTAKAAEKTKEGVQKGVGKTEQGVGKAADKTSSAVGKAGDKLGDTAVTTNVKTGLSREPLLRDTTIAVETANHVVTLRGTVPSTAAKDRAAAIAAGTDGVNRVVNELVVKGN